MKHKKANNPAKSAKKRLSRRRQSGKSITPRTAEEHFAKPQRFQELWNRVTHVIAKMRANKISLQQASREFGVDPRTVIRRGGSALQKSANGRFAAKSSDRLLRVLVVPTIAGPQEIAVRGSRSASQIGAYWSAAQKF